jgi:S1-C subfamily serine protease
MSVMRNTSHAILFIIAFFLLCSALTFSCISCSTLQHKDDFSRPLSQREQAPVDAFVLVKVTLEAHPTDCVSKKSYIDCDKLLKELPVIEHTSTGSGLLVESDMGPVILTAAHVCEEDVPHTYVHDGVTISILSMTNIKVYSPIHGSFTASVVRLDTKKDLCLLRVEKVFTHPVAISNDSPIIGDRVYSIAAPYGIAGSNLALVFSGFYSGHTKLVEYFTIPTRPGSSGAAVLNENWEVIGILQLAFKKLENVGMGSGLEVIRTFLFSPVEVDVQIDDGS